jgi:hypothetical protein
LHIQHPACEIMDAIKPMPTSNGLLGIPNVASSLHMSSASPPAPPTSILIVPFGPRLVFMTSRSPFAALMFMNSAAERPITSALGFRVLTDDIVNVYAVIRDWQPSNQRFLGRQPPSVTFKSAGVLIASCAFDA